MEELTEQTDLSFISFHVYALKCLYTFCIFLLLHSLELALFLIF